MEFKGVVFDLDGTLLDTIEDFSDSLNIILESLGCPTHGYDEYKYFAGNGLSITFERALPPDKRTGSIIKYCLEAYREVYGKRWANKTKPFDGMPELLDELTRRGMKLNILSNKPQFSLEAVVDKFLSRWKFDVVYGEEPSRPKKPDPAGALEIAKLLGIPPEQFLYLGDIAADMETAKAAGMYAVGVLWGFRKADELIGAGADAIIEKPLDLLKLL